jgi:alkanesulfonate monooxygenase SsuD/methylene tetrahydromethanopterin reductase-like flavin-dependent oxidoreductase (luciferase family)
VNFNGRFHVLREASLLPPPERPIPILVAGNGPRLLRLVARYADVWNTAWFGLPNGRLRERLRNLDAALAAEARDPSSLRLTVAIEIVDPAAAPSEGARRTSIVRSADAIKRAVASYEQLGIDGLTIGLRRTVDRLGDAVGRTSDVLPVRTEGGSKERERRDSNPRFTPRDPLTTSACSVTRRVLWRTKAGAASRRCPRDRKSVSHVVHRS